MADTSFAITAGSGTDVHSVTTSIGGTTVHDQVWKIGEPWLATYTVTTVTTSIATINDHVLQIMAGSTLNVYLRRLMVYQAVAVTTAAIANWQLLRLTTAGTGGSSVTPVPLDTTDSASGATAMTLPTAKGTEGLKLWAGTTQLTQTVETGGAGFDVLLVNLDFDALRVKAPRIPAGTSNGLALKWTSTSTGASVVAVAVITEANF